MYCIWKQNMQRDKHLHVTITAHFIYKLELQSYAVQTQKMSKCHTSANMAEAIRRATVAWQFTRKDLSIVTDNASNVTVAVELTGYQHILYFAHVWNMPWKWQLLLDSLRGSCFPQPSTETLQSTMNDALKRNQRMFELPWTDTRLSQMLLCSGTVLASFLEQQPAICAVLLCPIIDYFWKDSWRVMRMWRESEGGTDMQQWECLMDFNPTTLQWPCS